MSGSRRATRMPRMRRPRLVAALERQGELTWTLARLEAEWLEIAEALDAT